MRTDRQLAAMRELSIPEKNLFLDKQSGKDFERPQYKRLVWITFFALSLGVAYQGVHELQNVRLVAYIGQEVIVHGLGKVDAVEHFELISLLPLEKIAHLGQGAALGVHHHIGRMGLEQLRGQPEAGFAAVG